MKRWPIVLGRGGTVLLAVGLALFLVSLIPSAQLGSSMTSESVDAKGWWGDDLQSFTLQQTLTPEQTLDMTVNTTGTVNVTLVDTTVEAIMTWIGNIQPKVTDLFNVQYFDEFVKSNPTLIVWQRELNNNATIDYDYVPTDVVSVDQINVSLITSNYGSNPVVVQYSGSVEGAVAPTMKVRTLSEFAILIGAALTLPWLNELTKARRKFRRDNP